jgi:hypothetical protein
MSAASIALQVQARLIEERRAERITELRRHEAECALCGDGPTDGQELRVFDPAPGWTEPAMICRPCWIGRGEEADFTDLDLVWSVISEASR